MTVNTLNITSGPFVGNGVADSFAYTFTIQDKSQVIVFETDDNGLETTLTVDTDYTVAGIGVEGGGTITRLVGALPTDFTWFIRSDYIETQETDLDSQGGFFPDVHEKALDKLTYLIQQIIDEKDRSPSVSNSYTGPLPLLMPDPVAGKIIRWLGDLTGFENIDVSELDPTLINDDQARFGFSTLNEAIASTDTKIMKAGRGLDIKDSTDGNSGGAMWDVVLSSTVTTNGVDIVQCTGIGTLALVKRYNFTGDLIDSFADLILRSIPSGKTVEIAGYYTPGDGGGAQYLISDTDDDGRNIVIANGKFALIQFQNGIANIRKVGAVGDGTTNDVSKAQEINDLGLDITIPNDGGVFFFESALSLSDDISLLSNGGKIKANSGERLINTANRNTIRGIKFDGNDDTSVNTTSFAILANDKEDLLIENCQFDDFANRPIAFGGSRRGIFRKNRFNNTRLADGSFNISIQADLADTKGCFGVDVYDNYFFQTARSADGANGVSIAVPESSAFKNEQINIVNNTFHNLGNFNSPRGDVDIYNDAKHVKITGNLSITPNNSFFKANDVQDILIANNMVVSAFNTSGIDVGVRFGDTPNRRVQIHNNYVSMSTAAQRCIRLFGVDGNESKNCSVQGNQCFAGDTFGGIYCKFFENLTISDNIVTANAEFGIFAANDNTHTNVGLSVLNNTVNQDSGAGNAFEIVPRETNATTIVSHNRVYQLGGTAFVISTVNASSIIDRNLP